MVIAVLVCGNTDRDTVCVGCVRGVIQRVLGVSEVGTYLR